MLNEHDESAFPVEVGQTCDDLRGMSLLDWFAGQCLSGCLAYSHVDPSHGNWQENSSAVELANYSYVVAEAMMDERKRRNDERK
jgi:hypothetical protein